MHAQPPRRRARAALAGLLALLLGTAGAVSVAPEDAEAAVVRPMTDLYNEVVNGDVVMVGNGVLQAAERPFLSATALHNAVQQQFLWNDDFIMQRRNAVPALAAAGADDSTSATLQVPAGASVVSAYLFWQGSTGFSSTGNGTTVRACSPFVGQAATLPSGSPATRQPMLQVGSSGPVQSVAGAITVEPFAAAANPQYYSGYADVTAQVATIASGSTQTVSVGNLWAAEGYNCHAGWSLAVVYDFGRFIVGNDASQARNVIVSGGHVRLLIGETELIDYSGFVSQEGDIQAAFFTGEGDRNITGDYAEYRIGATGAFTRIPGATGETNNAGVGVANGSVRYQGTSTGLFSNANVDVRTTDLTNVPVGTTTIQLRLGTVEDTFMLQASALSVPVSAVRIEKTFTDSGDSAVDVQHLLPGQQPSYTITITNTGSAPLTGVRVADPLAASCARNVGRIAVAATVQYTCTGPATSTGLTNTATVTATGGGADLTDRDTTRVNVATIALEKSVTPAAGYAGRAGDVLDYGFTIRNTGTSPLTSVELSDAMPGIEGLAIDWSTSSDPTTGEGALAVGETVRASASYRLTQADVDAGSVTNAAAVASAADPDGDRVEARASATHPIAPAPSIDLSKSGALAPGSLGRAGDRVEYAFSATNTGNVTLTDVAIDDPLAGLTDLAYAWPGTPGTLLPGETVTATASLVLTQAQVDAGVVDNTATVDASAPDDADVSDESTASVVLTPAPAIAIEKIGTVEGAGVAGDAIAYVFDVTNTGSVTLSGVTLADPAATGITPPAGFSGTLAPGQTARFTGTHVITQQEIDAGSFANTAQVAGTSPQGTVVRADDTAVTPFASTPGIALDKRGVHEPGGPGTADDAIAYTFTIVNTGRTTLTGVALTDPLLGGAAVSYAWPGTAGTLLPGQQVVATATLPLTQAQIDAGTVVNVATATGTGPSGTTVESQDGTTTPIVGQPAIRLEKSATAPTEPQQAGALVPYAFTIVNDGTVTLRDVELDDPMFAAADLAYAWPGEPGVLAPGASVVVTASHPLTQAEIDAGVVVNAATATGTAPSGTTVSGDDAVTIAVPQRVALELTKSVALDAGALGQAGDAATYTFVLRNAGTTTITDASVTDPLPGLGDLVAGAWPGEEGVLLPGEQVAFSAAYDVTQADVDALGVANTATATGAGPGGTSATAVASAFLPLTPIPAISLDKTVEVPAGAAAGDAIAYAFAVENTGTATLVDVRVDDPLLGGAVAIGTWPDAGAPGRLAPGESVVGTGSLVLTQADVDRGVVENTATASGTTAQGEVVDDSDSAVATIEQPQSLTIEKSATLVGSGDAGSTIEYRFTVTNDGATTLRDVAVVDGLAGLGTLSYAWPDAAQPGVLAPGAQATATASYLVTQADVDAGGVDNTALATGSGPAGSVESAPDDVTVPLEQDPSLRLEKTADAPSVTVGSTITYAFVATNDGDVTLTDVVIDDPLPGLGDLDYDWSGAVAPGTLAPGQSVRATATLVVDQTHVDAGGIDNVATASGTAPDDTVLEVEAARTVPIPGTAQISLEKVGDADASSAAGDEVVYRFTVTNAGTVTLEDVVVDDALDGVSEPVVDWAGSTDPATPAGSLAPGEVVTATATYTLTQADVDRGLVVNDATATGVGANGETAVDDDEWPLALDGVGALVLDKTHGDEPQGVGDVVRYELTATNVGTVTLTGVAIDDPMLPDLVVAWPDPARPGTLAPGQSAVATGEHVVTQADVDAGRIVNAATATATDPAGDAVPEASADDRIPLTSVASIALEKRGTLAGATADGSIDYAFEVVNTGTATLSSVAIVDGLEGIGPVTIDWASSTVAATGEGILAPGERVTATATYPLEQADVERGSVVNDARVDAQSPSGDPVTDAASATVDIPGAPALTIEKSTDAVDPSVGDTVTYELVVENTGTVRLVDVAIVDELPGLSEVVVTWPNPDAPGVLEVGERATATASVVVTSAHADAGSIVNTAIATGTGRGGTATDDDDATVVLVPSPALALEKDGALVDGGIAGDAVAYDLVATNTGDVTLSGVTIVDPLPGLSAVTIDWASSSDPATPAGVLAAGETVRASATYLLTQADVDAGGVDNVATVIGSGPTGEVRADGAATVATTGAPAIALEKTATVADGDDAGDTVSYAFAIENVGTVTLSDVALTDPMPGLTGLAIDWSASSDPATGVGVLAPGETVQASAEHVLTQSEVDAGTVSNTATASGVAPDSETRVEASDTAVVPLEGAPALTIEKSSPSDPAGLGDTVDYVFVVTNAGDVTVSDVAIADELEGLSAIAFDWEGTADASTGPGVLAPGESVTATASIEVTQAHVDAGGIVNVATTTGTDPGGETVTSPPDGTTVVVPQAPAITIEKSGSAEGGAAGDVVTFGFSVENAGTVTLEGVTIADALEGLGPVAIDWAGSSDASTGEGVLAPGERVQATAEYVLTQADVDAGGVENAASVEGTTPGCADDDAATPCTTVTDDDAVEVPIDATAAIAIAKTVDREIAAAGTTLTYAFVVENVGDVTLTDVAIVDELEGLSAIDVVWPGEPGVLAPGERATATATYVVTEADARAGSVRNLAAATGTTPGGGAVTPATDAVTVEVVPPGAALPPTGAAIEGWLALVAALLVAAGALLVRRRDARVP